MDMLKYKIFNGVKKTFFWLMPLVVVVSLFYFLIADIAPITAQDNSDQSFSVERIRFFGGEWRHTDKPANGRSRQSICRLLNY